MTVGVSITFFCGATKLLTKQHGAKVCAAGVEDMRRALAEAEQAFIALPDEPKKSKRTKSKPVTERG